MITSIPKMIDITFIAFRPFLVQSIDIYYLSMKEFQERRKIKRKIYSKTSLVILLILIILLARSTWSIYQKEKESKQNIVIANNEVAELQSRHDLLQSQVELLKTPTGQEEAIRQKYQVAKDGEDMVVIIDSTSTPTSSVVNTNGSGFWSGFMNLFKR